jgi:hypothetical protein
MGGFNAGQVMVYRRGVKSCEIVRRLLGYVYTGRPLSIVDLTYGVGTVLPPLRADDRQDRGGRYRQAQVGG